MARDWKSLFESWARPASDSEEEKADRAAGMILEAINAYPPLLDKSKSIYGTGSYKNNTNTRLESDIDIAVVLHDCFYSAYPPTNKPPQAADLGHGGGVAYGLAEFRADVGRALIAKFGEEGVTPGTKAFDVHANSVRLDADVAVFLEYRRYTGQRDSDGRWEYLEGVEMRGANGARIINWHQQHHTQGINKNNRTRRRYKRVARILKRLRDDMRTTGTDEAKSAAAVSSFLLECCAYNAPDGCFNNGDLYADVKAVVADIWRRTKPDEPDPELVEVSGLKWLLGAGQPWTKAQLHDFLLQAWRHVGFTS